MKFYRIFLLLTLVLFFVSKLTTAQSAYDFLRLDLNPRAAALAGSFVTNTDDPNVIFYNPAGINSLKETPVSISYVNYFLDVNLGGLAISKDFENAGRFALGVNYINYGTFTRADEFKNKLGEFSAGDVAFTLGYANALDQNFYYGVNVKFIYSSIAEVSSSALGADLGLQYLFPNQQIVFGLSALNLGSQIKPYYDSHRESLPVDLRFGVSKKMEHIPLTLALSFNKLNENQSVSDKLKVFSLGAEFNLSRVLRLRLGYDNEKRSEMKLDTSTGLAGFNIGVGALIAGYNFDYSYSSYGFIDSIHRIGITFSY
ncbi:MAG TPA: type IX secretion system protein PorQ [Ignavibacteriales bacterium]|nr:type IX secretion system protein PorQ [Ignavibacteriales bacterium]